MNLYMFKDCDKRIYCTLYLNVAMLDNSIIALK